MTLMTESPEYKYWEMDNKELKLKDEMLPAWVAVINGLEALQQKYRELYPELFTEEDAEG